MSQDLKAYYAISMGRHQPTANSTPSRFERPGAMPPCGPGPGMGASGRQNGGASRRRHDRADLDAAAAPQRIRRDLDRHCVRFFGPRADGDQLGTPGNSAASPQAVVVQARTTGGAQLFSGRVAAAQGGAPGQADSARFDVPAGRVELDLCCRRRAGQGARYGTARLRRA